MLIEGDRRNAGLGSLTRKRKGCCAPADWPFRIQWNLTSRPASEFREDRRNRAPKGWAAGRHGIC